MLSPGDALYGRVVQGGTLLAIQARNEGITNGANFREKTRSFVMKCLISEDFLDRINTFWEKKNCMSFLQSYNMLF